MWISKYKSYVFLAAFVLIAIAGYLQWQARKLPCPTDKLLAKKCMQARTISLWIYFVSLALLLIGFAFAYVLPFI